MRHSILASQQQSARLSSTFSTPARVRTLALLFLSLSATGRQNCILILLVCCVTADQKKLEEVIMQLDAYCSSVGPLTQADLATLAPGAACCARFSGEEHLLSFECIEMYSLTCFTLVRT